MNNDQHQCCHVEDHDTLTQLNININLLIFNCVYKGF